MGGKDFSVCMAKCMGVGKALVGYLLIQLVRPVRIVRAQRRRRKPLTAPVASLRSSGGFCVLVLLPCCLNVCEQLGYVLGEVHAHTSSPPVV